MNETTMNETMSNGVLVKVCRELDDLKTKIMQVNSRNSTTPVKAGTLFTDETRNNIPSTLMEYAKKEFSIIEACPDNTVVSRYVLAVIEINEKYKITKSCRLLADKLIEKLENRIPISPLLGTSEEWLDIGKDYLVNTRFDRVIKDKTTGKCYYRDAVRFINYNSGFEVDGVTCKQEIKRFPFNPEIFDVDVECVDECETMDVLGDKVKIPTYHISDVRQLFPVWSYYVMPQKFSEMMASLEDQMNPCIE